MIKHLVLDVDGVLNTGHFLYDENGKRLKMFGPHDKDGLELAKSLGLTIDFVTADSTGFPITRARIISDWKFEESQLHLVKDGYRLHWLMNHRSSLAEVAYIGDGIHDVPILQSVGLGIAPCSGRKEAKKAAKYVTESPAGSGAVLDACLHIEKVNKRKFWIF
jgi:3-deoxy-D-manno-octulosonate 8-phosphate phosphatase (KDO 8-P phosphatase)